MEAEDPDAAISFELDSDGGLKQEVVNIYPASKELGPRNLL
jgi:hypothetical protein